MSETSENVRKYRKFHEDDSENQITHRETFVLLKQKFPIIINHLKTKDPESQLPTPKHLRDIIR